MFFYKSDYTIDQTLNFKPSLEQKFLLEYTGKNFPAGQAERIWLRVIDHKWHMSEKLNRDVGLRVAAVDYIQNFHKTDGAEKDSNLGFLKKLFKTVLYAVNPPPVSKKYMY